MDIKSLLLDINVKKPSEFVDPEPPKSMITEPVITQISCVASCLRKISLWFQKGINEPLILYTQPMGEDCCKDIMDWLAAEGFIVAIDKTSHTMTVTAK